MSEIESNIFNEDDISVVIPSYNSEKTIEGCLRSLYDQTHIPSEIIVVDSSWDKTKDIIREKFPHIHLISMNDRTFPGPARNIGAQNSHGRILAFIDSDCIANRDWISKILENHSSGKQIVGGGIETANFNSITGLAGHLLEFREFVPSTEGRYVIHVPSCNLSYRKDIFMRFGGFPNSYYPQEDLLFNYLISNNGIKIWFDPSMLIHHYPREGVRNFLSHQHRLGRVTRCVLKRLELPGSFVGKHPILAWTTSPLLGLMKFIRSTWFYLTNYKVKIVQFPQLLFILGLGTIWWARGFAAGTHSGLSGIRGWHDPEEPIFSALLGKQISSLEHISNGDKGK
ncbi:MAG: glycosyltransferase [Anaerolineaceae bacterium]